MLKETKTWISYSYLIKQSFQGYRCESDIYCHLRIKDHLKVRLYSPFEVAKKTEIRSFSQTKSYKVLEIIEEIRV